MRRGCSEFTAAKAASAQRVEQAKTIDMAKLEAAFATAGRLLKKPRLRIGNLVISPAKATSKNAGSLYVREGEAYLGKITGSRFIRSRDCTNEQEAELIACAEDPIGSAIRYGRATGRCACCGLTLTNAESVARGIGPICASNFGWG